MPPGTRFAVLDHGLTLITREDHTSPVVSAQVWCKAGSIHEGKWLGAGLSHVLEHMLFKGTTTRGTGRIDQEVQNAGGYMNAYTSFDRTVYFINVPNTGSSVAIDILCDIVQNATLSAEEMEKEKQVILREMDMNQDDPSLRAGCRLFETAYSHSPYRFPIIGCPDIYHEVQRQDVVDYYKERYAPNNIFFSVVGDIQMDAVQKQIQAAFAKAKAKAMTPVFLPEEPVQTAPRQVIEEAPIELGHVHFAWHVPSLRHPDIPIIDVLTTLLGSGRSSRLYRKLREEKGLVHSIDAWTYSPGNPGLFGISAVLEAASFDKATDGMLEELERMKEELIRPEELSKAVKQFIAATLSSRKTMQGQAQDLGGNWLVAGDLNFSARYLEHVKQITPEDLQRVARAYGTAENRTLYALLPAGSRTKTVVSVPPVPDSPIQKVTLANGLRLLVKEDHRLPFVEFRALFQGGVLAESPTENGLTMLMSKMLLQGTRSRTAERIAEEIESIGGHIDSYAANNSLGLNGEIMGEDFTSGLDLLSDVLLNPSFPGESFQRERDIQLAMLRSQRDELIASAFHVMRQNLFGTHPYGQQALGTETSLPNFQSAQLHAFHQRLIIPNNCVLAIFGDVQVEAVRQAVSSRFESWKPGLPVFGPLIACPRLTQCRQAWELRDKKQAVIVIGFPGASVFHEDRYALELIQESCSDLGSRLFMRIRDALGLAYFVGAQNMPGLVPGSFALYAGTAPEHAAQVRDELFGETESLRTQGLAPDELQRAKAKIIGQRKIARQDLGSLASTAGLDELYGLGFDQSDKDDALYERVTQEDIIRAAQAHLQPENSAVAVLAPSAPPS